MNETLKELREQQEGLAHDICLGNRGGLDYSKSSSSEITSQIYKSRKKRCYFCAGRCLIGHFRGAKPFI